MCLHPRRSLFCIADRLILAFVSLSVKLLQILINISLIVGHPPRIITPPKDQYVISGRVATFICSAIGSPNPQIEWRKNGRRLVTQRYSVIDFPNGSVLRIEPVKSVSYRLIHCWVIVGFT